jgi:hypothetical protein
LFAPWRFSEKTTARSWSTARAPAAPEPTAPRARVAYLDNLKLLLVASIIAAHGIMGYSDLESAWPYQDVQEVQLGAVSNAVLSLLALPAVLFVMGLFFLISGLVTPGSVARKGPRLFARDRLVRLGVPLALWALVIWAGAKWAVYQVGGETSSFWWRFVHSDPFLDTGPMWFVEVLLIYSLVYAAWRLWRGRAAVADDRPPAFAPGAPLSGRTLIGVAVAISAGTVLVRLVFPILSGQIGQSKPWQWPQFVAMFGLGIVAAQRGWLAPVPDRIRRGCGFAALFGVLAFLTLAGTMVVIDVEPDVWFEERLHWAPMILAAIEGPLAVGFGIWMLGVAQRRLDRRPGPFGRAMTRSAYAAFILQGVVLTGLMIALRPLDLPAEIKALAVAALGVALSFGLAWLLISRTRIGRIV